LAVRVGAQAGTPSKASGTAPLRTSGTAPLRASAAGPGPAATTASDAALPSGTYAIEGAADLEGRGLYHFLYLHPSGRFLLAGEWAHNESSRAAGQWTVQGSEVTLTGSAHVDTNQGRWDAPFRRVFRRVGSGSQTRLEPLPEKNHFGMLGWPNAYAFKSPQPAPSLPSGKIPRDDAELLALIATLSKPATDAR